MTSNLAGVFNLLLQQPTLAVEMQRRIAGHGIANRDYQLLARLAEHTDLHPEVDHLLRDVNSAVVKTAWVSRNGRKPEEIADLVLTEKRVKVLATLAQTVGMPETLYHRIVERSANRTVLNAVQGNDKLSLEVRKAAGRKLVEIAPAVSYDDNGLDPERYNVIRDAIRNTPQIVEDLLHSNDLYVLVAAAECTQLPEDVQLRLVKLYEKRYGDSLTKSERFSYYSSPGQGLLDLASNLIEHGPVGDLAVATLDVMLTKLSMNTSQNWMTTRIQSTRDSLGRSGSQGIDALQARLAAIDDIDAMTTFVNETDQAYESGKLDYPDSLLRRTGVQIIGSSLATPQVITTVSGWFGWGDETSEAVAAAGRHDPARIAAVISGLHYVDIDEVLDNVDCADEVMRLLVEESVKPSAERHHSMHSLLGSKHFKPEHIRLVPLGQLLQYQLQDDLRDVLLADLHAVFSDDEAWNSFMTLAEEFEGPVRDLITVCHSL